MDRRAGYTLLEALITVAVAALVAGAALPELGRSVAAARRTAAANELLGAFQRGRAEAIKRHAELVLCGDDGDGGCLPAGEPWAHGYVLFVDEPPGRPYRPASPAAVVAHRAAPAGLTLLANREAFALRPLARRSSNGTVRLCPDGGRVAPRALILSVTGRPRVSARLPDGTPIPCPPA